MGRHCGSKAGWDHSGVSTQTELPVWVLLPAPDPGSYTNSVTRAQDQGLPGSQLLHGNMSGEGGCALILETESKESGDEEYSEVSFIHWEALDKGSGLISATGSIQELHSQLLYRTDNG